MPRQSSVDDLLRLGALGDENLAAARAWNPDAISLVTCGFIVAFLYIKYFSGGFLSFFDNKQSSLLVCKFHYEAKSIKK